MNRPTGHMEIRNKKFGADVILNGSQLFVLEDGFEVNADLPGLTTITMTIAVKELTIRDRED